MNNVDFHKLTVAVKKILTLMAKERLGQLRVSNKDLHRLANLTNTRTRSLMSHVDDILTLNGTDRDLGEYATFLVADHGITDDGEMQMVFIKQNSGLHHLVLNEDGSIDHK